MAQREPPRALSSRKLSARQFGLAPSELGIRDPRHRTLLPGTVTEDAASKGLAQAPTQARRPLSRYLSADFAVLYGEPPISPSGLEVSVGAPLLVRCLPRELLGGVMESCLTRS